MAEPLILWSETLRFLQLLGRSTEDPLSVHGLLFPPKEKKKDSAFAFYPLTEAGGVTPIRWTVIRASRW
jgi:hypothetical protein